ncbi:CinA family protein [Demequina sp. NBRC 110055]|uniref:CinA family protein n=1 Tax=Demequina sp. NBRC 110055 TaxID=1570344 RepID=UPI000A00E896|nr:CinA family protein [Demequina sp. NBRC 110055]
MPTPDTAPAGADLAGLVLAAARARSETVACAESLTGGALSARLIETPGASEVVRGAIVAYQLDVKTLLLGVEPGLLDDPGPVSEEVARAMATGVVAACGATVGLATTGAAGPEPHGGRAPGTVCVAVAYRDRVVSHTVAIEGDRAEVRRGAVDAALALALEVLGEAA